MKTYSQKPESVSRTLDSHPQACRQASISDILQAYEGKMSGLQPFQWKSTVNTPTRQLSAGKRGSTNAAIQCAIEVGGTTISKSQLRDALKTALKGEVRFIGNNTQTKYLNNDNETFTPAGVQLCTDLWDIYQTKKIKLTDSVSLIHQVSQDINLLWGDDVTIVGTPHQHSDYAIDATRRHPGQVGNPDMRIYRSMPKFAWDAASLRGHGGSLGEAMNYFRQGKRDTHTHPTHIYYLVEFTLPGKKLNDMVGGITGGSEGTPSTPTKFGGKNESTSEFGMGSGFFSVDMAHADDILSTVPGVRSRVIASTGDMPDVIKQPGRNWKHTNQVDQTGW